MNQTQSSPERYLSWSCREVMFCLHLAEGLRMNNATIIVIPLSDGSRVSTQPARAQRSKSG